MKWMLSIALMLAPVVARADRAAELRDADRLLADGAYEQAEAASAKLLEDPSLAPAERAETQRVRGLSLFFLDRKADSEQALRAYLQLIPDAHLDPALVPPEAVVFFEEVRARHSGAVRAAKPRPKKKPNVALNILPPMGQFQNGQPVKGWVILTMEVTFLATNVATYAMLRSKCRGDLTCDGDPDTTRVLRMANLASGALALGSYAYGVIDGIVVYRMREREPSVRWGLAPTQGGLFVGASGSF